MATFLLCWELGAGAGHCANLLPIAEGLILRGHKVFVAARDINLAGKLFKQTQVHLLQAPFLNCKANQYVSTPRSFAHIMHNTGFSDDDHILTLLNAWRNLIVLIRPEVMVFEHAPMALLASRFFEVRRAVMGTGFFSPPDQSPLPDLRPWLPDASAQLMNDEKRLLSRINRILEAERIPVLDRLSKLYADVDANYLLTFAELDHYQSRGGSTYWGMWSVNGNAPPSWPAGNGLRLFGYLKPQMPVWNLGTFLKLLRQVDVQAILYIPGASPEWLRDYLSPNISYVTQAIDIKRIASTCDVAVLNGNAGTSTHLLLAGVPQLNLPIYLEQTIYSIRVASLNAGVFTDSNHPDGFSSALNRLIYQGRSFDGATRFSKAYAIYNGMAVIEQIVFQLHVLSQTPPDD